MLEKIISEVTERSRTETQKVSKFNIEKDKYVCSLCIKR